MIADSFLLAFLFVSKEFITFFYIFLVRAFLFTGSVCKVPCPIAVTIDGGLLYLTRTFGLGLSDLEF